MDIGISNGMLKALQNVSSIQIAEDSDGYIYVTGQVAGQIPSDFGVMRFPLWCSQDLDIGSVLTVSGDPLNKSNTACSGQIVARGRATDVFLVKYNSKSGEQQFLKRFGQLNTEEEASGLAVDPVSGEAFIAGSFSLDSTADVLGYHDTFDLVSAGRPKSLGCPVNPLTAVDSEGKRQAMDPNIGTPNCSFTAHTRVPKLKSAYFMSISIFNLDHGKTSRPWSQCLLPVEQGCDADGLLWAKSIGSGVMEVHSTTAQSVSTGIIITRSELCSILTKNLFDIEFSAVQMENQASLFTVPLRVSLR